jgi:hypothetical protein
MANPLNLALFCYAAFYKLQDASVIQTSAEEANNQRQDTGSYKK